MAMLLLLLLLLLVTDSPDILARKGDTFVSLQTSIFGLCLGLNYLHSLLLPVLTPSTGESGNDVDADE
uniref:Uncharacterized protein n=1 Tax=Anopheles albimanus TaxID=7167 RepID=A0A182FXU5_ANOAL